MTTSDQLQVFEQDPAATLDYSVDFANHCARIRESDTDYPSLIRVRPFKATGFQYLASTGGRTAAGEPRWPMAVGGTVRDGSVIWTAEVVSTSSLSRSLVSASWTADPSLTVSSVSRSGTISTAYVANGTLGQRYLIRVTGSCSDSTAPVATFMLEFKRPLGAV